MGPKKGKKEVKTEESEVYFSPGYGKLVATGHTKELLGCEVGEGVTEDRPAMYVEKEILIEDMKKRAAVSDFAVHKKLIMDYPEDKILLVYDEEFKYGSAYYLCLTIEAKNNVIKELHLEEVEEGEEEGLTPSVGEADVVKKADDVKKAARVEVAPRVEIFYPFKCEPRPWVSLGSEKEVDDEQVKDKFPPFHISVRPIHKMPIRKAEFSDALASQHEQMCLDMIPAEDEEFEPFVTCLVIDVGVQTCLSYKDGAAVTIRPKYMGACNQYELVTFDEEELNKILSSASLQAFLRKVEKPMLKAIHENECTDLFKDEFAALESFVSKDALQEDVQPEVHFTYTQGKAVSHKMVSCVSVSPLVKGLFAISYVENATIEEYVDNFRDVMFQSPCTFISSLCNLDLPKVILQSYEEVGVLSFNPLSPNLIAGGTRNGLMLLWDLTVIADFIANESKQYVKIRKPSPYAIENLGDNTNLDETVIIRPATVSSSESRHPGGVACFDWLPSNISVDTGGETTVNSENDCLQILTSGYDGVLKFWSLKKKFGVKYQEVEYTTADCQRAMFTNVKSTYSVLDDVWKPFHAFRLPKASAVHSYLTCFIFKGKNTFDEKESGKNEEPCTHLIGGSSDGFIVDIDWLFQRNEAGNMDVPPPKYYTSVEGITIHDGPVQNMPVSPFMEDIFLSVGSSTLGIWQKDLFDGPLFLHVDTSRHLTAAAWSPSRPAVFVVASDDGEISTWNILKGNPLSPVMIHKYPVVQDDRYITNIKYMQSLEGEQLQMYYGSFPLLPLLKLPDALCHPEDDELLKVRELLDHEVRRVKKLAKFHADQSAKKAAELKKREEEEKVEREKPQKKETAFEVDERTDEEKERDFLLPKFERFKESEMEFLTYVGLLVPEEPEQEEES